MPTLLATLLGACGTPGATYAPYAAADPLTARLPLAEAGVRDERTAFAALFAQELRAQEQHRPALAAGPAASGGDRNARSAVTDWLHVPDTRAPSAATGPATDAAETLAALEQRFRARSAHTAVLLVPGLFGDCVDDQSVPFGDGAVRAPEIQAVQAYAGYADLGLHSLRLVRLPGRHAVERNGAQLAEAIRATAAQPGVARIVLVGYSKGVPDALHALRLLQAEPALLRRVTALVSVAGAVMGTPLADAARPLVDAVSPHWDPFNCSPSDGQELASITPLERLRWWAAPGPSPAQPTRPGAQGSSPSPALYTVLAYAAPDEMSLPLRATQAWLARLDPRNDGQVLASDAVLPGSTLLAAARSDHWDLALPRERHPNPAQRALASGRAYPREALLRATLKWVLGSPP